MLDVLLIITAAALLATKALDVLSTWRHVSAEAESNPIARRWLLRFGLARGLALASAVYLAILALEIGWVWWLDLPWLTGGTVALGLFVAWAQWDVARYNQTRCPSWFTRRVQHAYNAWHQWLVRPRRARARIPPPSSP